MNPEAIKQFYGVLDTFGIAEAQFLGYWDNADLIGGQTQTLKASAYRKPGGGALVVVYNAARQECKANLGIDWDKLRSGAELSVVDAYTSQPVAVTGSTVTLAVPFLNYRLLWVE